MLRFLLCSRGEGRNGREQCPPGWLLHGHLSLRFLRSGCLGSPLSPGKDWGGSELGISHRLMIPEGFSSLGDPGVVAAHRGVKLLGKLQQEFP